MVARDLDCGRAFLALVLDKGEKKPSRARSLALYGDALLAFRQGKIEESRLQTGRFYPRHDDVLDNIERVANGQEGTRSENRELRRIVASKIRFIMDRQTFFLP
jgi:hypothetical protein